VRNSNLEETRRPKYSKSSRLAVKTVLRNNILRWLLLCRERVQSRKEDYSK
jgi:hypothetical protein